MLSIIKAPNEVLLKQAGSLKIINKDLARLIREMEKTLVLTRDPEGVGLAAPQIGKPLQIFIVKPNKKSKTRVFINPSIIFNHVQKNKKLKNSVQLEGCLSLPTIWGNVKRVPEVKVNYLDEFGKKRFQTFKGFLATIIQHEFDHLNGILFPKRVLEQKGKLYKSRKDENGKDILEEIEI